jgi:hypothetical protein
MMGSEMKIQIFAGCDHFLSGPFNPFIKEFIIRVGFPQLFHYNGVSICRCAVCFRQCRSLLTRFQGHESRVSLSQLP